VTVDVAGLWSAQATGGSSYYVRGRPGGAMPIVFEAGLPDPATFPVDELARIAARVLERDRNELQYGTPIGGDLSYGFHGLRELLAERTAARDGRDLDVAGVMLTSGGGQAISLAVQAFVDPGDHVVVEAPTWEYPLRDLAVAGARTTAIPLDDDGLRIDLLEAHLADLAARGERLKLVYTIATFNVPTGVCLSLERRRRLVALAHEHGFVIVEDNVYGDLRYEGEHLPTLSSLDRDGVVVTIESFSKTVMPGLRLGWVSGHPDAIEALARVRRDLGVGQLIARVVAEYVGEGRLDAHIAAVCDLNRSKRDVSLAAFQEHCTGAMTWNRPPGGYFIWLELADHVDGGALQRRALGQGVVCRPGERFYGEPEHGRQRMRFAFTAVPADSLERAIAILGEAAEETTLLEPEGSNP
jgi:2-aminoadipate transaminase